MDTLVLRENDQANINSQSRDQVAELGQKYNQMNMKSVTLNSEAGDQENVGIVPRPSKIQTRGATGQMLKRQNSAAGGISLLRHNESKLNPKMKKSLSGSHILSKKSDVKSESSGDGISLAVVEEERVKDIDLPEEGKPQMVAAYACDIYDYLFHLERELPVKADFLEGRSVNHKMRTILVDWLVQVHGRFQLLPETLYLTLQILDQFLQIDQVQRSKLQLVGVTAMLIASKYEEIHCPEISDFVFITDNSYTKPQIIEMEIHMLKALNFSIHRPFSLTFLRRFSKAGDVKANIHQLAKYLLELTFCDYSLVHVNPSEIAAAALKTSLQILSPSSSWTATLSHYSRYSSTDLEPTCSRILHLLGQTASSGEKCAAVYKKYTATKFAKIALDPEVKATALAQVSSTDDSDRSKSSVTSLR
jgi:hypothetical protein